MSEHFSTKGELPAKVQTKVVAGVKKLFLVIKYRKDRFSKPMTSSDDGKSDEASAIPSLQCDGRRRLILLTRCETFKACSRHIFKNEKIFTL